MRIVITQRIKLRSKYNQEIIDLIKDGLASFVPYWESQTKESVKSGNEYVSTSCDFNLYCEDSLLLSRIFSLNKIYSNKGILIKIES